MLLVGNNIKITNCYIIMINIILDSLILCHYILLNIIFSQLYINMEFFMYLYIFHVLSHSQKSNFFNSLNMTVDIPNNFRFRLKKSKLLKYKHHSYLTRYFSLKVSIINETMTIRSFQYSNKKYCWINILISIWKLILGNINFNFLFLCNVINLISICHGTNWSSI